MKFIFRPICDIKYEIHKKILDTKIISFSKPDFDEFKHTRGVAITPTAWELIFNLNENPAILQPGFFLARQYSARVFGSRRFSARPGSQNLLARPAPTLEMNIENRYKFGIYYF